MFSLLSGYGVILVIWGILFEVAGCYGMILLTRGIREDERHQDEQSDVLLTAEPEMTTTAPVHELPRIPGSHAA